VTERIAGVVVGLVSDIDDPSGLGRIRVRFPWMSGEPESNWARVATIMAGNELGAFFMPQVGDEALIAFEKGNIDQPYVIGFLWSGENTVPGVENEQRIIKTYKGHTLTFDDRDGEEAITIEDANGNKVTMNSDGITIESDGDIKIKGNNVEIEATAQLTAKGNPIHLNP
jgi:uncharacterized protein involved in type VI secretion and phage assembly